MPMLTPGSLRSPACGAEAFLRRLRAIQCWPPPVTNRKKLVRSALGLEIIMNYSASLDFFLQIRIGSVKKMYIGFVAEILFGVL